MPITFNTSGGNMPEVIADQDYYYDAEGNITTDESKGERWLARKGAAVLDEHKAALSAFREGKKTTKAAALAEDEDVDGGEKASSPSANKKAAKPKNKSGAK